MATATKVHLGVLRTPTELPTFGKDEKPKRTLKVGPWRTRSPPLVEDAELQILRLATRFSRCSLTPTEHLDRNNNTMCWSV